MKPVKAEQLDLGYLALFVGMRVNALVLEAAGQSGLRESHGYIVQHLLGGPLTIGELAKRLEVTQQAASKSVAELERLGYLEEVASDDARVRRLQLSARGRAGVARVRALRAGLERKLERKLGPSRVAAARRLLAEALEELGGASAVRRRRVPMPR